MTFDLSAITDSLINLVKNSWDSAPLWAELELGSPPAPPPTFTPNISGLAPDVLGKEAGPQLSLFLYHVEANNSVESLFWAPQSLSGAAGPGQPVRFLPFALNMYYLMSAFSEENYHQEQQAMSVALRIFHANPILRDPLGSPPWELTLTMEHRSYDEMSLLWQATTAPMRFSVVYRAAVVFLDPDTMPKAATKTKDFNVAVEQAAPAAPGTVELFGTFRRASYVGPTGPVSFTQAPATVAPGQQVWLMGANLTAAPIALVSEEGVATDISGWVVAADSTASRVVLQVPDTVGSPPGPPPATGRYQVRVGGDLAPLSLAAYVDPAGGPVLPHTPSISLTGEGFVSGSTEVLVGTILVPASQITVGAGGTSLTFPTPAGPPGTVAPIGVRVRGIESDPALWVTL
jgi:Pvc16 N-terminal domain